MNAVRSSLLLLLVACSGEEAQAPEPAPVEPVEPAEPAPAPGWTFEVPPGMDHPPAVPDDNPMSAAKVELGHALFLDPRLSVDGSRSCYSCHVNERGNADGRKMALGAADKPVPRNTPTIWNVAYLDVWYWDGRADSLEKQALGAWKGGNMGVGDGLDAKAAEIGAMPEYAEKFREIFGLAEGAPVEPMHVAQAISAYERTLLCGDSSAPLSEAAERGKQLFQSKGRCITCHTPPRYTDSMFHDIGLGYKANGKPIADADPGRGKVTGNAEDNGRFRTPTLRNASRTAPYFHDGRAATLEEAVRYMAGGGNRKAPSIDPLLQPADLTDAEVADVVAFLETLTCEGQIEVTGDPKPVATE